MLILIIELQRKTQRFSLLVYLKHFKNLSKTPWIRVAAYFLFTFTDMCSSLFWICIKFFVCFFARVYLYPDICTWVASLLKRGSVSHWWNEIFLSRPHVPPVTNYANSDCICSLLSKNLLPTLWGHDTRCYIYNSGENALMLFVV